MWHHQWFVYNCQEGVHCFNYSSKNGCSCNLCVNGRRLLDEAEVAKSKVSEKLLDAQHEVLHLKSSLEVCPLCFTVFKGAWQVVSAKLVYYGPAK